MCDHEAAWAASAPGSGEAEQEKLLEDAEGGSVRRSRRTLTVPVVPTRVLENFCIGGRDPQCHGHRGRAETGALSRGAPKQRVPEFFGLSRVESQSVRSERGRAD
jgi:hypothetical protein